MTHEIIKSLLRPGGWCRVLVIIVQRRAGRLVEKVFPSISTQIGSVVQGGPRT
jgi:hypothetical protein